MTAPEREKFEKWSAKRTHLYASGRNTALEGWEARQPEIDALKAEVEILRNDAERYRYLKANALIDWVPDDGVALVIPGPNTGRNWKADTDKTIDAAMADKGE